MTKRNELGHTGHRSQIEVLPDEREPIREILQQWVRNSGRNLSTWSAPVAAFLERLGAE